MADCMFHEAEKRAGLCHLSLDRKDSLNCMPGLKGDTQRFSDSLKMAALHGGGETRGGALERGPERDRCKVER